MAGCIDLLLNSISRPGIKVNTDNKLNRIA